MKKHSAFSQVTGTTSIESAPIKDRRSLSASLRGGRHPVSGVSSDPVTAPIDSPAAEVAICAPATLRLAECLAEGGTVVNYGLMSGEPCQISPHQIVFRGITLTGFWLAKTLGAMTPAEIQDLYRDLAERLVDGTLHVPVEATYDLDHIRDALRHAAREARGGKVLLTPNAA